MDKEHDLYTLAQRLGQQLQQKNWYVCCAESCTGGGLAQALTDVAGSSAWFDRGFVTYSNAAKQDMLGVMPNLIEHQGAVSLAVAESMAKGALMHSQSQLSVAISGIAGPGGGSKEKPVGTVCFAWGCPSHLEEMGIYSEQCHFAGDRQAVRQAAIVHALTELIALSQPTAEAV